MMVSVDIAKYPERAHEIRRHAARWIHGGATAQMPRETWEAIKRGDDPPEAPPEDPPAPEHGPGTELKRLIAERFGVNTSGACGCEAMRRQMDQWGVEGCRARREEIADRLIGQAEHLPRRWKWVPALPGGRRLVRAEAERLVDEAIERTA